MEEDPLGFDSEGNPVFLKDIWPSSKEIAELTEKSISPELFNKEYKEIFKGSGLWNDLKPSAEEVYHWDKDSTYIKEPPFFINFPLKAPLLEDIHNAKILALLGTSVTTDHISPAGAIPKDIPAGTYLLSKGIKEEDFNSFGSRRGNHEVMMRGTFGNIRIRNKLVDKEGGWTVDFLTNEIKPIYDAAMDYINNKIDLIVIAGNDYGMGSSRDWAAKGTQLLGVKAVIAESYERIHRSNLVGMGVLPLQFKNGENPDTLGLNGSDVFSVVGIKDIEPFSKVKVIAKREGQSDIKFEAIVRLDSNIDVEYYKNGGILQTVLRKMLKR
ncbi:MAG: aconitate hydratase, partial [Candidatus Lokiarchaeota archaeon]|nr:aconitate hydratase [Candidatus Lokiarchaeota archaeon]